MFLLLLVGLILFLSLSLFIPPGLSWFAERSATNSDSVIECSVHRKRVVVDDEGKDKGMKETDVVEKNAFYY